MKFRFYGGSVKKQMIASLLALSPMFLTIGGCADRSAGFPSLKPRAIETAGEYGVEEPQAQEIALGASEPERVAAINEAVALARRTVEPFNTAIRAAEAFSRRGAGAARGSDNWVAATMAISRAEALRTPVKAAMNTLDDQAHIILFRAPTQDGALIRASIAEVEAIDQKQQNDINALNASINR
jgi:hypothetical protein